VRPDRLGTERRVTAFVMGLFVVQLLLGGYLFSFTLGQGREDATARATRLPSPVLALHPLAGLAAAACWFAVLVTDARPMAWITLGLLVVAALGGAFLAARTLLRPPRLEGVVSDDPADTMVIEKQMPTIAIGTHGLVAVVLLASVAWVAVTG